MKKTLSFSNPISNTSLISLWMRAYESHRPNGLFKDHCATRLVEQLPFDFSIYHDEYITQTCIALRTEYFDAIAKQHMRASPNALLVNLGCGLDARFQRTDRGKGSQIDLDLPDVIAVRNELMPATSPRNTYWEGSLLETEWMDRLLKEYPDADLMFMLEGVLMYFEEEQVRNLLAELAHRFEDAHIVFDICSPLTVKNTSLYEQMWQAPVPFVWGVANLKELEHWHPRLCLKDVVYYFNRHPERWGWYSYWHHVPKFGNATRIVHYQVQ